MGRFALVTLLALLALASPAAAQAPFGPPNDLLALGQGGGDRPDQAPAVNGNPATEPGWVAFYDLHQDCRHPELDFSGPLARLGHESGFSADGKTFYATATAYQSITAIDVTDPKVPFVVWQGNVQSHGM